MLNLMGLAIVDQIWHTVVGFIYTIWPAMAMVVDFIEGIFLMFAGLGRDPIV